MNRLSQTQRAVCLFVLLTASILQAQVPTPISAALREKVDAHRPPGADHNRRSKRLHCHRTKWSNLLSPGLWRRSHRTKHARAAIHALQHRIHQQAIHGGRDTVAGGTGEAFARRPCVEIRTQSDARE